MTRSQSASVSVHPRPLLTCVPPRLTVGCPTLTGFGRVGKLADRLWDFSLFRHFLWDVWDKRGWGPTRRQQIADSRMALSVNSFDKFPETIACGNLQVTQAYFIDSKEAHKKLEDNNLCDHNVGVIAESTHPDFQLSLPGAAKTQGPSTRAGAVARDDNRANFLSPLCPPRPLCQIPGVR
jgi:hypothetical protein